MNSETGEVRGGEGLVLRDDNQVDLLGIIEQRNSLLSRILLFAIKATHGGQWVNQEGKPWPTAAAAEVMARRCAVRIDMVQTTKTPSRDDRGEFYMYVATCRASLPGGYDSIEAVGTASSRDKFLGTDTKKGRALSEIEEGNILKKAYSNMEVNAITRLLGVRSLTWKQLEEMGIKQADAPSINREHGAQGGGQSTQGSDLVLKFGPGKDQTIGSLPDEQLTWYATAFERDLKDESKSKYHANTQKQLAAVKDEQSKRANAKAGTVAKPVAQVTVWTRILQLCTAAGMTADAARPFVKGVTKKEQPSQLVEADITAVSDALAVRKTELEEEKF